MSRLPLYTGSNPVLLEKTSIEMSADILKGTEAALFGPDSEAITVAGVGHQGEGRSNDIWYYSSYPFLSRFVCLGAQGTENFDGPFSLAIAARSRQLSAETADGMSEEEIRELGYADGDAINMNLIRPSGNMVRLGFGFYTSPGDNEGYGSAGSWSVGYSWQDRAPDLSWFEAYMVMAEILEAGQIDQDVMSSVLSGSLSRPTEELREAAPVLATIKKDTLHAEDEYFSIVPETHIVAERCQPFFYGLFKRIVETPEFLQIIDFAREKDVKAVQEHLRKPVS